ncbi:MAG: hypothetical protein GYA86_06290 [Firmicutes bacterium]|nr:hypothetical protein [Bacillota bacterium]
MRVIVVFIDGMGLGKVSPENPFVFAETPFLETLFRGNPLTGEMSGFHDHAATLRALDAQLGVSGLPQSATGQAALFTGINAPHHLGYHLSGFPNEILRTLLRKEGLFGFLRGQGYRCAFINAYRPQFFEQLGKGFGEERYSCSTLITYYGGLPFHGIDHLARGQALFMDLTNELLNRAGFSVPVITPEEAGKRLIDIGAGYDFSLFEYFITDYAGHQADPEEAGRVIGILDRFLGAAAARLDPEETLLLVTSDHGNIEDLSHGSHTLNPVPALLIGAEAVRRRLGSMLGDLTDIKRVVRTALKMGG